MNRILHATDFSPATAPAFRIALDWARRQHAGLRLVHVMVPPAMVLEDSYLSAKTWQDMLAATRGDAEERLKALAARAARAGIRVTWRVLTGVPFEQIVREARRSRATLVVVGTRGRTGLAGVLLGSVARAVVGRARCPVLTVRG
jgi:nucleotide-binding universal stress UspA family protein